MMVLPARTFRPRRYRPGDIGTWSGHLPFVNDLIAALRPSLLVELGTHYGESYFGMCQAVQENAIACKCYAVDTWGGDAHAGYYDESVFDDVNRYNEVNYASFSTLLRTTFDQAQQNFGDYSVDLLHLDGLHTYEALRHDFDTWFGKVRPGGVVLIHDTSARHADFGVWKVWEELTRQFPHFEFTHSWGLGVLRKPGGGASDSELLEALFSGSLPEQAFLRHYYSCQAELMKGHAGTLATADSRQTSLQVFPPSATGYSEVTSAMAVVALGEWQQVVLELPQGSPNGRIRIDPADRPCLIQLGGVILRRARDGSVLREWREAAEIRTFVPVSDLVMLPGSGDARFLSTGRDPQFLIPELDPATGDQPLIFEARLRITEDLTEAVVALQSIALPQGDSVVERDSLRAALQGKTSECEAVIAQRDAISMRAQQLSAEIRHLQAERIALVADYRQVHALNESLLSETVSLRALLASEQDRLNQDVAALIADLDVMLHSRSWRLTAPLRRLFRALR
jgi:hypothetical protein